MISKDMHPYFFYLWLEWSDRLKLATPDCKKSNEASATQGIGARSRQFGDYASKRLLQTALDASMTDVDFSLRGCV